MAKQTVVFHERRKDIPDGKEIPVFIMMGGKWESVGVGLYEKKNSFITIDVDDETPIGLFFLETVNTQHANRFNISTETSEKETN